MLAVEEKFGLVWEGREKQLIGGLVMGCAGGVTVGLLEGFVLGSKPLGLGRGETGLGGKGLVMWCL